MKWLGKTAVSQPQRLEDETLHDAREINIRRVSHHRLSDVVSAP
jgi:hypothetical protein